MRFAIALALFPILILNSPLSADDVPQRSAELQVLDRMVGNWETVITAKPAGETFKTVQDRKWSKEGKFVLSEDMNVETKEESHYLVTYDPNAKRYRGVFVGEKNAVILLGTWNEDSQTMNWVSAEGTPAKHTATHRFIDKDHIEWSMVVTAPDGKVLLDLSAKQTRRKP